MQLTANDHKLAAANNEKIAEFYAKTSRNAALFVENQLINTSEHSQIVRNIDKQFESNIYIFYFRFQENRKRQQSNQGEFDESLKKAKSNMEEASQVIQKLEVYVEKGKELIKILKSETEIEVNLPFCSIVE